ncbi:hypothetical protein [Pleurocapsa sp. CCALA 161]|uniref:hypothetical protein n=1 Tax=Pleurocapsa sp. CCALA 161 TaxID=2107688 RepID=UPI001304B678|nr:hypothetical protein [Pleurocapsa sp. CCALA 161]
MSQLKSRDNQHLRRWRSHNIVGARISEKAKFRRPDFLISVLYSSTPFVDFLLTRES